MKCRVEARDLRQGGRLFEERADRCKVVRLVQWRQRHEFLELRKHRRIDAHRLTVFDAAMDHAVADGCQPVLCEIRAQKADEMLECAIMTKLHAFAPRLLGEYAVARVFGDEPWRGEQAFGLAAHRQREFAARRREQRELDAR